MSINRIILPVIGLFMTASTVMANDSRIVKETQAPFERVIVNGDITVEIIFDNKHKGYIVYNSSDDSRSNEMHCFNDSSTLILSGTLHDSGITSRVVVVACDSLTSVINNGNSSVLIKELPRVATLDLVTNGKGDIKANRVQAHHLQLVSNTEGNIHIDDLQTRFTELIVTSSGKIHVEKMKSHGCKAVNTGSGEINLNNLLVRKGVFSSSGTGAINLNGRGEAVAFTTCGNGSINAAGFKAKRTNQSDNNGKTNCRESKTNR